MSDTSMSSKTAFEDFLNQQNEEAWSAALATLLRSIHEVDRAATQIWFAFYPLSLCSALQAAEDREKLARALLLQGDYELKNQIDSSHHFLYGHRFWPQVKRAVEGVGDRVSGVGATKQELTDNSSSRISSEEGLPQHPTPNTLYPGSPRLADQILEVARRVAKELKKDDSLLVGITAVAFMTLQQVGLEAFRAASGSVAIERKNAKKSPEHILRERTKDDSQGMFGFLKTVNKQWTVTWEENDARAKYKLREGQDLAWGAAEDQSRDWRAIDPRRIEGPIPVECRSASCGTCWVGVLGGAEKLSDVAAREGKKIKEFGYIDTAEPKPLIRLACQAQASGAVSIVIPPWNGQFGKYLKSLAQAEQDLNLKDSNELSAAADDQAFS
jgi:ferredoxin